MSNFYKTVEKDGREVTVEILSVEAQKLPNGEDTLVLLCRAIEENNRGLRTSIVDSAAFREQDLPTHLVVLQKLLGVILDEIERTFRRTIMPDPDSPRGFKFDLSKL